MIAAGFAFLVFLSMWKHGADAFNVKTCLAPRFPSATVRVSMHTRVMGLYRQNGQTPAENSGLHGDAEWDGVCLGGIVED